jgi:paraquat-inducible protein B
MSEQRNDPKSFDDLPKAKIERNWKTYFIWVVPVIAAALAGWFIYSNLLQSGPTLHIYFDDAAGLQRGKSQVKYRGAEIGEVKNVRLTKDHRRVDITVSLDAGAESIAHEGSRFWIVKPEVSVEQIRGLRTIVAGDYITVEPGDGPPKTEFDGLPEAPVIEPQGVLRIVLLAERLGSVNKRAPVFYRGVQVGEVFDTDLGHASQTIRITVDIKSRYAELVRLNSKFWNAGGIHANLSLSGINIAAQSAEALLSGGIDFATPDTAEKEAPAGTEFRFYDKPEDAWLGWAPAIELKTNSAVSAASTNNPSQ